MVVLTYVFGSSDPWFVIFSLISDLCLVLCCDIYRSTLISIMYPACMITVHDRKSRALEDSCIQNRGVANYLLSLLFSLVSLPFSFFFCVLNQKYQKYLLLLWVQMKPLSCVPPPATTTFFLSPPLFPPLPLQHLLMR